MILNFERWKDFLTSRCVSVCASMCMCMLNCDVERVLNRGPTPTGNDVMLSIRSPPEECSSKVFPGNDIPS